MVCIGHSCRGDASRSPYHVGHLSLRSGTHATSTNRIRRLTGNAICKAANLPHFARIETPMVVGAIGGFFGTALGLLCIVPLGRLGEMVDKRYKQRHIRSGRISRHSTRTDGHFPVLLFIWIPLVFLVCLLSGPISASFNWVMVGVARELSKADITRMSAIGAVFVAPGWTPIALVIYGVAETIYQFFSEILEGHAGQGEPDMLPYLWRQGEALIWLFRPIPRKISSRSLSTNV